VAYRLRLRFWFAMVLVVASAFLVVLTLTTPGWIEAVFGIDLDNGSGFLEVLVAVLPVLASAAGLVARREHHRARSLLAAAPTATR